MCFDFLKLGRITNRKTLMAVITTISSTRENPYEMFRLLKIPVVDVFVMSRWKIFGLVSSAAIATFVLTALASIVGFNVTRNVHHHQNAQNNDHHHEFDKITSLVVHCQILLLFE
jgi:hypothetical protein